MNHKVAQFFGDQLLKPPKIHSFLKSEHLRRMDEYPQLMAAWIEWPLG